MKRTARMRVGIAGCGGLAGGFRLPAYADAAGCELVGFFDVDPHRAEAFRDRYRSRIQELAQKAAQRGDQHTAEYYGACASRVVAYPAFEAMLEAVDGVDVITPPGVHVPLARQALAADKAVLVEKPLARTWWEAAQLAGDVERAQGIALYAENWLFSPVTLAVRQLVESGVVGTVEHVSCRLLNRQSGLVRPIQEIPRPDRLYWRADPHAGGGGAIMDFGIHIAAAAWFVAGLDYRPVRVRSGGMGVSYRTITVEDKIQPAQVEDDGIVEVLLEQPASGAWCTLTVHTGGNLYNALHERGEPEWLMVQGTRGQIRIVDDWIRKTAIEAEVVQTGGGSRRYGISTPYERFVREGHHRQVRHFAACWADGAATVNTYDFGLDILAIIGGAYLSEVEGRRAVPLEEFRDWSNHYGANQNDGERVAAQIDYLLAPFRP